MRMAMHLASPLARLWYCALASVLICAGARADSITFSYQTTFTNFQGDADFPFGVPTFDPNLGTLNAIVETLTGDIVVTGTGTYYLSTENGIHQTSSTSGSFSLETVPTSGGYVGTPGFPGYRLSVIDAYTTGTLSFSSIGPVVNTYRYDYTPATPEPGSLLLLGTGVLSICAYTRNRSCVRK